MSLVSCIMGNTAGRTAVSQCEDNAGELDEQINNMAKQSTDLSNQISIFDQNIEQTLSTYNNMATYTMYGDPSQRKQAAQQGNNAANANFNLRRQKQQMQGQLSVLKTQSDSLEKRKKANEVQMKLAQGEMDEMGKMEDAAIKRFFGGQG